MLSHLTSDVTELWRNRNYAAGSFNYAYPAQAAGFLRLWATPAQGGTTGPVVPCRANLGEVWRARYGYVSPAFSHGPAGTSATVTSGISCRSRTQIWRAV